MADTPSAVGAPDAQPLDGTEHVLVSQSGNQRRSLLTAIRTFVCLQIILPTADPHVVGALWNSSGTITISAG